MTEPSFDEASALGYDGTGRTPGEPCRAVVTPGDQGGLTVDLYVPGAESVQKFTLLSERDNDGDWRVHMPVWPTIDNCAEATNEPEFGRGLDRPLTIGNDNDFIEVCGGIVYIAAVEKTGAVIEEGQPEQDWSRFDMRKAFVHVLDDVDSEIRNGSMPWNVNTWNDLAEFVDPNDYVISALQAQGFKVHASSEKWAKVVNELTDRIDRRLTAREAEVVLEWRTGDVAAKVLHVPWLVTDPYVVTWTDYVANDWTHRAPSLSVATAFLAALMACGEANWEKGILQDGDGTNAFAAEFIEKAIV